MPQCTYKTPDPRDPSSLWNCSNQQHPVGDDGQLGHEPPPNIGYAVKGPWGLSFETVEADHGARGKTSHLAVRVLPLRTLYYPPINIGVDTKVPLAFSVSLDAFRGGTLTESGSS